MEIRSPLSTGGEGLHQADDVRPILGTAGDAVIPDGWLFPHVVGGGFGTVSLSHRPLGPGQEPKTLPTS